MGSHQLFGDSFLSTPEWVRLDINRFVSAPITTVAQILGDMNTFVESVHSLIRCVVDVTYDEVVFVTQQVLKEGQGTVAGETFRDCPRVGEFGRQIIKPFEDGNPVFDDLLVVDSAETSDLD